MTLALQYLPHVVDHMLITSLSVLVWLCLASPSQKAGNAISLMCRVLSEIATLRGVMRCVGVQGTWEGQ